MLTAYLSHPFTGNEKINRKKARKTAMDIVMVAKTHNSSIAVLNPCDCIRYAEDANMTYAECIDICLKLISGCDVILLATGWENSRGCILETAYALANNIKVCLLPETITPETLKPNIDIQNHKQGFTTKVKQLIKEKELNKIPLKSKFLIPFLV